MANESQTIDLTSSDAALPPSTNSSSKRSLWARLRRGSDARARFVESHLSKNLAFQIRAMRDQTDWSQEQLAEKVGTNQNAISRLENPNYGKATITTLKRIASVFDVALVVRFVPFSQLVDWVSGTTFLDRGLSSESLTVPSFENENRVLAEALGPFPTNTGMAIQTHELLLGSISDVLRNKSKSKEPDALSAAAA
jgi:transcriptional regulator with XRE-family HTH domain